MVSVGIAISVLALVIAILGLAASYDRLVQKIIHYLYDPRIEITLQHAGDEDTSKQFHISEEDGFNPTYHDEFEIPYHKFPSADPTVGELAGQSDVTGVDVFNCTVNVHAYDDKLSRVQLRVITDGLFHLRFEERRRADPEEAFIRSCVSFYR